MRQPASVSCLATVLCQQPLTTGAQTAGQIANRENGRGTRLDRGGRAGRTGRTGGLAARLAMMRSTEGTCPDVPFVSNALQAEATMPIKLLLHYACGFVEAALISDCWPAE